jgi:hypothetical protein
MNSAAADAGRGARDGRRSGDPAEKRRDDVAESLPDQLRIRIVPGPRKAVGDHRTQQRLDRGQHRDCEGRTEQRLDELETQLQRRPVRSGQLPGQEEGWSNRRNAVPGRAAEFPGES